MANLGDPFRNFATLHCSHRTLLQMLRGLYDHFQGTCGYPENLRGLQKSPRDDTWNYVAKSSGNTIRRSPNYLRIITMGPEKKNCGFYLRGTKNFHFWMTRSGPWERMTGLAHINWRSFRCYRDAVIRTSDAPSPPPGWLPVHQRVGPTPGMAIPPVKSSMSTFVVFKVELSNGALTFRTSCELN